MQTTSDEQQVPEGVRLLRIIYKWRRQILILVVLAGAGAAVFTSPFFILPYYKSEVIFYPPGTNSNKILIERDPRFGSDKEIDEQIQILKSSIVRDSITGIYKLVDHYDIDTTDIDWTDAFYKQLEDNISIERTQYNSISVKVYDTDPAMAASMANDMVRIGDAVKSRIIKDNLKLAYISISKEYFAKSMEIDTIIEGLNEFIQPPISHHGTQKDKTFPEKLKEQLDVQFAIEKARSVGKLKEMEALYNYQLKLQQLNEVQSSYFQAYTSLNSAIPSCYIITPAEPSYKKAGPKRLIIFCITVIAAFVFGSGMAVLIEKYSAIKQLVMNH